MREWYAIVFSQKKFSQKKLWQIGYVSGVRKICPKKILKGNEAYADPVGYPLLIYQKAQVLIDI